jgi:hypothetical protein
MNIDLKTHPDTKAERLESEAVRVHSKAVSEAAFEALNRFGDKKSAITSECFDECADVLALTKQRVRENIIEGLVQPLNGVLAEHYQEADIHRDYLEHLRTALIVFSEKIESEMESITSSIRYDQSIHAFKALVLLSKPE